MRQCRKILGTKGCHYPTALLLRSPTKQHNSRSACAYPEGDGCSMDGQRRVRWPGAPPCGATGKGLLHADHWALDIRLDNGMVSSK
mmetsp:Transcript_38708/g.64319  ORF Transcript_38708/g.64319 Transcript_38708/m.64319 type:complete len:86 (+) Transcript_38708:1091-1348(+)